MNSGLNLNSGEQSWWKQPHMPGRIMVLTAVLTFSYFFGQKLMYGIFGLFGAMWGLIACGLTIGLVFFFYKHVITAFEVLSYKLADFFIKIDPITNARVQLSRAWRKLMILKEAVTDLTGQLLDTNTTLQTNQSKIDKNIDDAKRITNDTRIPEDDKQDVQVLVAEAEELRKWNEELLPLRDTMLAMRDGLKAAFNAGDLQLREQKARLDINEQKYKSIAVTWGAIFKAQGLFGGNPGQRNEFELAMKEIQRSTSQKAAKIDSFMEMIKPIVRKASIAEKVNDSKVRELIEKIKTGEFNTMVKNFEQNKIELQVVPPNILEAAKYASKTENKYNDFLNK